MDELCAFFAEEEAIGVVEIILILVVLIGLVMIFKKQLVELVENILDKITKQSEKREYDHIFCTGPVHDHCFGLYQYWICEDDVCQDADRE